MTTRVARQTPVLTMPGMYSRQWTSTGLNRPICSPGRMARTSAAVMISAAGVPMAIMGSRQRFHSMISAK